MGIIFRPSPVEAAHIVDRYVVRAARFGIQLLYLLGIPQLCILVNALFSPNNRPLSRDEKKHIAQAFGTLPFLDHVRYDGNSRVGTHGGKIFYVFAYQIKGRGDISLEVLIHEMVHVIQFHYDGLRYIPTALYEQIAGAPYAYGGYEKRMEILQDPQRFFDLGYEQQAELWKDLYFASLCGDELNATEYRLWSTHIMESWRNPFKST